MLGLGAGLFVGLFLLFMTAARSDVSNLVPATVSGGSGTVSAIQADDGVFHSTAEGNTVNIGGLASVGGDISSVVLHVKFTVESAYSVTNPILVNGVSTGIVPSNGDTQRSASIVVKFHGVTPTTSESGINRTTSIRKTAIRIQPPSSNLAFMPRIDVKSVVACPGRAALIVWQGIRVFPVVDP